MVPCSIMCSPSPPPLFPPAALPQHLPHLIPAMQHYAWVLRTCHAGAELDTALTMCQGLVDDDLRWHLYDLAAHRDARQGGGAAPPPGALLDGGGGQQVGGGGL
jgi:hypothetical protein